jgi:hypothetical protein
MKFMITKIGTFEDDRALILERANIYCLKSRGRDMWLKLAKVLSRRRKGNLR